MTYQKEIAALKRRGVAVEVIRDFKGLERIRNEFVVGHHGNKIQFLIVIGSPGTGKTHTFQNIQGTAFTNNAASPVGLYQWVYESKRFDPQVEDMPLIVDDVDGLFENRAASSLFKALGNDSGQKINGHIVKIMSWLKQNSQLLRAIGPSYKQYTTTSRLCVLMNDIPKMRRDVQAVFDRAHVVIFEPTAQAVHDYVQTWKAIDKDIMDYIGNNLHRIVAPSCRWYTRARNQKNLGRDWKQYLFDAWVDEGGAVAIVGEIRNNPKFDTFKLQVAEFQRRTGLKRASYNLYLQQYKEAQGIGDEAKLAHSAH